MLTDMKKKRFLLSAKKIKKEMRKMKKQRTGNKGYSVIDERNLDAMFISISSKYQVQVIITIRRHLFLSYLPVDDGAHPSNAAKNAASILHIM